MKQAEILSAVRRRTPDSFAPDGQPLKFVPVKNDGVNQNQVFAVIGDHPEWGATQIAYALGCTDAYVRATARRWNIKLPRSPYGAVPSHSAEYCRKRRSKPTPAQPHEACGVVHAGGDQLSRHPASMVSVNAPTVVNGTGPQCLDDSGQQLADSNRFVIPHGEAE